MIADILVKNVAVWARDEPCDLAIAGGRFVSIEKANVSAQQVKELRDRTGAIVGRLWNDEIHVFGPVPVTTGTFPAASASRTAWIPLSLSISIFQRGNRGSALNGGNGVRGDGFAAPQGIHALIGFGFQINLRRLDAQRLGQRLAHRRKVRPELGTFGDDDGVNMDNARIPRG